MFFCEFAKRHRIREASSRADAGKTSRSDPGFYIEYPILYLMQTLMKPNQ
jgi:hypothetical protein